MRSSTIEVVSGFRRIEEAQAYAKAENAKRKVQEPDTELPVQAMMRDFPLPNGGVEKRPVVVIRN